jgi:succinyl-CoA synthetase beta subunit
MRLLECQGKELFREAGIPVPKGSVLPLSGPVAAESYPVVAKAQVLAGGRGKAGGVRVCRTQEELREAARDISALRIRELPVRGLLLEEALEIEKEYYLACLIDGAAGCPVLIASAEGGTEIESVAEMTPEKILRIPVHPSYGLSDFHVRRAARFLGCGRERELADLLRKMLKVMSDSDATLVEINPLVETPKGLVALDSKMNLDDHAFRRRRDLFERLHAAQVALIGCDADPVGEGDTITYVPMDGTVGLISDGAGTGMLSLDLIVDAGGRPADFCEMGGLTDADVMYRAIDRVLSAPGVRSLLIVLIGGFVRMDEMAEGIARYHGEHQEHAPFVVRLCGTKEAEGRRIMAEAGLETRDDLQASVREAVERAGRA